MVGIRKALSPNAQNASRKIFSFTFLHSNNFHERQPKRRRTAAFLKKYTEVLSATFLGRWMGRGGSTLWPPRSPDLTPLYIFFWGYVNNYVYMDENRDLNHLKARRREAAEQVTRHMLQRVWREVEYRVDICSVTDGAQVETYSSCSKLFKVHFKTKY
jgi:hypothetical protein